MAPFIYAKDANILRVENGILENEECQKTSREIMASLAFFIDPISIGAASIHLPMAKRKLPAPFHGWKAKAFNADPYGGLPWIRHLKDPSYKLCATFNKPGAGEDAFLPKSNNDLATWMVRLIKFVVRFWLRRIWISIDILLCLFNIPRPLANTFWWIRNWKRSHFSLLKLFGTNPDLLLWR